MSDIFKDVIHHYEAIQADVGERGNDTLAYEGREDDVIDNEVTWAILDYEKQPSQVYRGS